LPNATTTAKASTPAVATTSVTSATTSKVPVPSLSLTIDDDSVFETIDWALIENEARETIRQKNYNNSHDENYSESHEQPHMVRIRLFMRVSFVL
jgi:hypothetical protein